MTKILKVLILAAIALISVRPVFATVVYRQIMPLDYSFSPTTDTGDWALEDPYFTKLTDGVLGNDNWTENPDRWVGWKGIEQIPGTNDYTVRDISLSFVFGATAGISTVILGTNQDAINNWNVVYPSSITVAGQTKETDFDPNNSGEYNGTNNGRRHEVRFDFKAPITSNIINITINNNDNFFNRDAIEWDNSPGSSFNGMFWILLDEVEFYEAVPSPGSLLLFASGLIGLICIRSRSSR